MSFILKKSFTSIFVIGLFMFAIFKMPAAYYQNQAQAASIAGDLVDQNKCGNALGDNPLFVTIDSTFNCTLTTREPVYYLINLNLTTFLSVLLNDGQQKGTFSIWKGSGTTYGSLRFDYRRYLNEYFGNGVYVFEVRPDVSSQLPYTFSLSISTSQLAQNTATPTPLPSTPTPTASPIILLTPIALPSPTSTPIITTVIPLPTLTSIPTQTVVAKPIPTPQKPSLVTIRPTASVIATPSQSPPDSMPSNTAPRVPVIRRFFSWVAHLFGF